MSLRETGEGVILSIFVKPNSPKFKIELDGTEVVVYATEEPERGKVNKEILKELTKIFHAQVDFVSGMTSKQKILLLKGTTKAQVEEALTAHTSK